MNIQEGLKVLIQRNMDDLINANGLEIIEISDTEVLLKSETYTIDIFADREGINTLYFDKLAKPIKGYNILLFLIFKRHNFLTSPSQTPQIDNYSKFIEVELAGHVQGIRSGGLDIIAGERVD